MDSSLGAVLRQLREERKLSKSRLAREAGISDAYVVQIEHDDRSPSEEVLMRLAHVLRVPPHRLLIPAGYYTPEEIARAERAAGPVRPSDEEAHASGTLQPDLRDRILAKEFDIIDYYKHRTPDEFADESVNEFDLPADRYWGWDKPLRVLPPENWEVLSDADRSLVQKLINRIAAPTADKS
jgi:transcriptional regulator with XRE-family HTH domain